MFKRMPSRGSAVQLSLVGHISPEQLCRGRHRMMLEDAVWPSPKQGLPRGHWQDAPPRFLVGWFERGMLQVELSMGVNQDPAVITISGTHSLKEPNNTKINGFRSS